MRCAAGLLPRYMRSRMAHRREAASTTTHRNRPFRRVGVMAVAAVAALLAGCGTQVAHGAAEAQAAASRPAPPIPAATLRLVAAQQMASIRPLAPGHGPGIGDRARL